MIFDEFAVGYPVMEVTHYPLDNDRGWVLDVQRIHNANVDPDRPPVLMVPGYGMNTFILGFHPRGRSMVQYLCDAGFEVWLANLRGQGKARRTGGKGAIGFEDLALHDLPMVIEHIVNNTGSVQRRVHAVGCSLGGTFLYVYMAHHRDKDRLASMTSIGGPFRWDEVHPLVKLLATSPRLIGSVPIRGTRLLARAAIPLARRFPALLSPYMNARNIDLSQAGRIVQTVDDPPRRLSQELAQWILARELTVRGRSLSASLDGLDVPILCVVANGDGVVPPGAVSSVESVVEDGSVDYLHVGTAQERFAHADLFINDLAEQEVFAPLADWLQGR
jgi:poly(3-hydroxyalkanoate) synthetase